MTTQKHTDNWGISRKLAPKPDESGFFKKYSKCILWTKVMRNNCSFAYLDQLRKKHFQFSIWYLLKVLNCSLPNYLVRETGKDVLRTRVGHNQWFLHLLWFLFLCRQYQLINWSKSIFPFQLWNTFQERRIFSFCQERKHCFKLIMSTGYCGDDFGTNIWQIYIFKLFHFVRGNGAS